MANEEREQRHHDWMAVIAERKIVEAMEQGVFDNLPGKGKPLNLDDDPLTPPHMRAANRMLKNAGVVPEWAALEREIADAKSSAVALRNQWTDLNATASAKDLADARSTYERLLKAANFLILKYNMANSFAHREPIPFRVREELAEWDASIAQGDP